MKNIQIRIKNHKLSQFQIKQMVLEEKPYPLLEVVAFSIDPVMKVWLSGAKTNFRQVRDGDIMNCFGLAKVIKLSKNQEDNEQLKIGQYLFGNTGTQKYFYLDPNNRRQVFQIPTNLIQMYGQSKFLYLINNGLAAYSGFQIMNSKQGQNVVVSTAAGATSLLLCQLLKQRKSQIIAITSKSKLDFMKKYTKQENIINYQNNQQLQEKLSKIKFRCYFDNVGESILDKILSKIDQNGVIALCGAISNYHDPKNGGIKNSSLIVPKRLTLTGINFSNLIPRASQIFPLYKQATLYIKEIGPSQFQQKFKELLNKSNSIIGKIIIRFSKD